MKAPTNETIYYVILIYITKKNLLILIEIQIKYCLLKFLGLGNLSNYLVCQTYNMSDNVKEISGQMKPDCD